MSQRTVMEFYDARANRQLAAAWNDRHLMLLGRLAELGLRADSRVLEIGCGVGATTALLHHRAKNGHVLGLDISPRSIEEARATLGDSSRVHFLSGDILDTPLDEWSPFNLVVALDVFEHIPRGRHRAVFHKIRALAESGSRVILSVPNPAHTEYLRDHDPQALQVIDESVWAHALLADAYDAGLTLARFESLSVWHVNDYHLFVLACSQAFEPVPVTRRLRWMRVLVNRARCSILRRRMGLRARRSDR